VPKKKALKQAQQPKAPMTKREATRWQKQKRQERLALGFVIATIVLVTGIIFYGIWVEILSRPGQTVATVGSAKISLGMLAEQSKYEAKTLDQQIVQTQYQLQQVQAQAAQDTTMSFLVQYVQQQLQQLQQQRIYLSDGSQVLENLIQQQLVRQEVIKRGGSVTASDIDLEIQRQFQPQEPASQPITDTAALTDTVGATPTVAPTPIPADAWKTQYQDTLTAYNIADAEFRKFTMEGVVWQNKLSEMIGAEVPTTSEQVHLRQILFPTEDEARNALLLMKDVPSMTFAEMAQANSTDTATKDNGGDLGWIQRGEIAAELETVAFTLAPGQVSDVISTTQGAYIIKVEEKDPNHALTQTQLDTKKSAAFSAWLEAASGSPDIKRYLDSSKQTWLSKQIPTT
jgi:foldase protein PrsA